jgi:uncharacterized iron-regulated membrane protein
VNPSLAKQFALKERAKLQFRASQLLTGLWVSFFALFLLFTGLPWAKSWGSYFKKMRGAVSSMAISQDWTTGRSSEIAQRVARNGEGMDHSSMGSMGHGGASKYGRKARMRSGVPGPDAYEAINRIVPAAAPLNLAYPVQISPPLGKSGPWTVKSDSKNRTLRDSYTLDASTAAVLKHETFSDRPFVDRMVSLGISAHEGHLFGWLNQLVGVFTAGSLALLSVSSIVLWWRRRPAGLLGAPPPLERTLVSRALVGVIVLMGIYLPMLGI